MWQMVDAREMGYFRRGGFSGFFSYFIEVCPPLL
jgi:hypothetical protein